MQADDPPCLSVGTAVSAKYKGAFCEAKVSNAVHVVKCKVSFKMGLGTYTINDDHIKGTLRIGQIVQARHPEKREHLEATVMKIQDCSQYTVVFDDGDITTLRRSALCLKSGRHFNESETLDQLPLTHPEHFGNPVVGGRRGRRNRQAKEDSSEEEVEEENELDLGYSADIGRVVSIETTDKKRSKDNWFPGLVVIPSAQPTVRINVKDEYLARSFKDGRYYTVPKKEVSEFSRDSCEKIESSSLAEAVQKALKYLNNGELPVHWERSTLFNLQSMDSESEDNYTDSCDDEPSEEKDLFVAQLYKFMEDARTPLNTSPTIAKRDVDLHRLYRIVEKLGGYNRVTNQNKWKTVTSRMRLPTNHNIWSQVQNVYKTYLSSFESFYRTLGVTMTVKTRSNKKNRGRSLIRDKDRATPVNSPKPEKEEEPEKEEKVEEKVKRKADKKEEDKKKKEIEVSDTNSTDTADQSEGASTSDSTSVRSKRSDSKQGKEKKVKAVPVEKSKPSSEPSEEHSAKIEEKVQQTRSKTQTPRANVKESAKDPPRDSSKEPPTPSDKKKEIKPAAPEPQSKVTLIKSAKKPVEDDKKRGRKRTLTEEKASNPESTAEINTSVPVNIGDRLIVYYGPNIESKMTYEAKVIDIKDSTYLVHYTGWNTRYDEWILQENIAVNLSAKNKPSKIVQTVTPSSKGTPPKVAARRGRGMSITGRSSTSEHPRSTTPSSVTSSSSRTKSPATPATRSTSRITRQDSSKRLRRSSAQTETSVQSESDSDDSESEVEAIRTRSGSKTEPDNATPLARKRIPKVLNPTKIDKRKLDISEEETDKVKRKGKGKKSEEELEKEEETERPRRIKQVKKSEDEDTEREEEPESLKQHIKTVQKCEEYEDSEKEVSQEHIDCITTIKKCEEDLKTEEDEDSKLSMKLERSEDDDTEKENEIEKSKILKRLKKSPEKIIEDSDDDSTNLPKGRDFDLNQIRLELKGLKVPPIDALEKDVTSSDESVNLPLPEKTSAEEDDDEEDLEDEDDEKLQTKEEQTSDPVNSEDIYEFKEPEPFEFETRKITEEKGKKRIPRLFEDVEKSPKKTIIKSPRATENKDSPSPDKKRVRKSPRKLDDSDEESNKKADAFDKLVESPSYNMGKSLTTTQEAIQAQQNTVQQQNIVQQQKAVEKILEEPLFSENIDVYRTERLDLSDNELLFTRGDELFNDSFLKSSPDHNLELDFCKPEEPKNKESDEEDSLRESIQRVIAQTSTDEESNDALRITPPTISYQAKKKDHEMTSSIPSILTFGNPKIEEPKPSNLLDIPNPKKETEIIVDRKKFSPVKHISPALQETDSSLLESIVAQPPLLATCIPGDTKDLNVVKTITQSGPKIADTLLQKLSLMKQEAHMESQSPKNDSDSEDIEISKIKEEIKPEIVKEEPLIKPSFSKQTDAMKNLDHDEKIEVKLPGTKLNKKTTIFGARSPSHSTASKSPSHTSIAKSPSQVCKAVESPSPITVSPVLTKSSKQASPTASPPPTKVTVTPPAKATKPTPITNFGQELKKRRKVLSRPYIEDTDSDSSDSEQLVIARSDDDSQTNIVNIKPDNRESLSNFSLAQDITTDDSQSQEEVRNFKFDDIKKEEESSTNAEVEESKTSQQETESSKEEEHDLRDLLICEETIPRSPAPSTEGSGSNLDNKTKNKSVLEMPFASAPGSSNNKTILLSSSAEQSTTKPDANQLMSPDRSRGRESSALDNTPPASPPTPESPMCMSPSGTGRLSPNESLKSNEEDSEFTRQRRNSTKISPYSEEDTQMTSDTPIAKKQRDDEMPGSCRKRRKSSRCDDIPVKRGRKPLNRSRHNSDSDDTSEEQSTNGSTNINTSTYRRSCQTPRPTKYNFYVEFDSSVDRAERIAIIMQKLTEIRKTYADVKSELAAVERRRKKLRRREREGRKQKYQADG